MGAGTWENKGHKEQEADFPVGGEGRGGTNVNANMRKLGVVWGHAPPGKFEI